MHVTKKQLETFSRKKLIDLIYEFQYWIFIKADYWYEAEDPLLGITPTRSTVTLDKMHKAMENGEITAQEYRGGVLFKRKYAKLLEELYKDRIRDQEEKLEKIGLSSLIEGE